MTYGMSVFATVQDTTLSMLNIKKSDIALGAKSFVENILSGRINAVNVAIGLSTIEGVIKEIKGSKEYVEAVRETIERQGERGKIKFHVYDDAYTIVENAEVGVKYDYSQDQQWSDIERQIAELNEVKKKREEFLKTIPAGHMIIDQATGEVTYGPPKTSTSSYKVTIAK